MRFLSFFFGCFSMVLCGVQASEAQPAVAAPALDPNAAPPHTVDGYLELGFDRLGSFPFNPVIFDPEKPNQPPPSSENQIPSSVKKYDDQKALVTGYMLPTKTSKGLVTEFLLLKDPSLCCFGVVPAMNQWIIVRMPLGTAALQDVPLSFLGRLHVHEIFDNGYLSGIYLLDAEKMFPAPHAP